MFRTILLGLPVALLLGTSVVAQVPPRYEIVQLTENSYFEFRPAINNRGQIVFVRRLGANEFSDEIFLYNDGEFIQLTDDDVRDANPDINDDGTIVWSRGIGADGPYGPTLEVVIYEDGNLTRLTEDGLDDHVPEINGLGHVAWYKWIGGGCQDSNSVICFYDADSVEQISDADWSHAGAQINDDDWITWTRYNSCDDPWTSDIMLYVDGDTIQLTDGQVEPQVPDINNVGQVVWQHYDAQLGRKGLQVWQDANTTTLTDWGMNASINDHGDIYFIRWYEQPGVYQAWLYLNQTFYQLTDDPWWNVDGDINNAGSAVWPSGPPPWGSDLRLLRPVPAVGGQAARYVPVEEIQPRIP